MILIGKYVNTHGIKGEIRIKSDFKYKDKVFFIGNKLIIDNREYEITSYRVHKEYDMVTFKGINDINEIISLKGSLVYVNEVNLNESEYLDSDLINLDIYMNGILKGSVTDIRYLNKDKKLLEVSGKLIPFELVENIDFKNKRIDIKEVIGLL